MAKQSERGEKRIRKLTETYRQTRKTMPPPQRVMTDRRRKIAEREAKEDLDGTERADGVVSGPLTNPTGTNQETDHLIQAALENGEGELAACGALVVTTGSRTGRSPKDKFLVKDKTTEDVIWWGNNEPVEPATFEKIWKDAEQHLKSKRKYVVNASACADPSHSLPINLVTEFAWHALFAKQLFRGSIKHGAQKPWTILGVPTMEASGPELNSKAFIGIDLRNRRTVIAGTRYAGEIKKSIFTVLNRILPDRGVFPMHCSANVGEKGDVALFFGLSGTGKTTISTDPHRRLIGDDEHGWSDDGVFNFEGGCYAKCIRLSRTKEPEIYKALRRGAVAENVVVDPTTGEIDFDDASITENTRVAYPLSFIPGAVPEGRGGHPAHIVFLTADAFGVLPPVARLTPDQAAYHFLSGFTSKLAGTEAGMGKDPEITFSTCFGAPFLPLHPTVYASMLIDKIARHNVTVFLVNTGWTGGGFETGKRIDIKWTRAIVKAALAGELDDNGVVVDPIFGLEIPNEVAGIPEDVIHPRRSWADTSEYDATAKDLAARFQENFDKFAGQVDRSVVAAGPR